MPRTNVLQLFQADFFGDLLQRRRNVARYNEGQTADVAQQQIRKHTGNTEARELPKAPRLSKMSPSSNNAIFLTNLCNRNTGKVSAIKNNNNNPAAASLKRVHLHIKEAHCCPMAPNCGRAQKSARSTAPCWRLSHNTSNKDGEKNSREVPAVTNR